MKRTAKPLIEVSPAELQFLVNALSTGLECDSSGSGNSDDPPSIINRWKTYRHRYFADEMAHYKSMGQPAKQADVRCGLAERVKEAAMLARLYPLLVARKAAA